MSTAGARPQPRPRPRLGPARIAAVLVAAAALGLGVGVVLHLTLASSRAGGPPLPEFHGQATWAVGARPAPAITLRDQAGHHFSLASLHRRARWRSSSGTRTALRECPLEAGPRRRPGHARCRSAATGARRGERPAPPIRRRAARATIRR